MAKEVQGPYNDFRFPFREDKDISICFLKISTIVKKQLICKSFAV